MSTTATYTASMRTRKVNASANYITNYAAQGYASDAGSNMVGIIHFPSLTLANKVITAIKFTVTSQAISSASRTVKICRSNYQEASRSNVNGANYCGSSLGTFTGTFNGGTTTYTISGSLLTNLSAYFAAGNNTITLYDSAATSSSPNNLCWTVCRVQITYEEGISEPTTSVSTAALGTTVTISTHKKSSTATHTLKYSFGSASGTIATGVVDANQWTPPLSLASEIPSALSGVCTITCETYYGGTLAGTRTCTVELTVPDSVVPTISNISTSESVSGLNSQFACYVQSKSRLSVAITAAGSYGSTITSVRSTLDGVTYTGTSFTSSVLSSSGTLTLSVTATDTRGRTTVSTRNITVAAYASPSITAFTAERCNSNGTSPQIDGTKMRLSAIGSVSSVNSRNTVACRIYYKLSSASAWTLSTTLTVSNYTLSVSNTLLSQTFNNLNSYDLKITLQDYFTTVEQLISVSTKQVMMDFYRDGSGVAFGKVAEQSGKAEFRWPLKLSEALPISEGGTGATTAAAARTALGAAASSHSHTPSSIGAAASSHGHALTDSGITGVLPVSKGGTGASTAKNACIALGIFYADTLPSTGTEGQICLVPIS